MNNMRLNRNGFTLIELLVVISLIGILSGVLITVINPQGLRAKARDAQRKSDLKQIQTALELYYADNRKYPTKAGVISAPINGWVRIIGTDVISQALVTGGYINNMPLPPNHDPAFADQNAGGCNFNTTEPKHNNRYNYTTDQNGSLYTLTALMESNTSDEDSKCGDIPNWTSYSHCNAGDALTTWEISATNVCYGVQNP